MIIKNANVFNENGCFEKRDIFIKDTLIVNELSDDFQAFDAEGLYAIPGLTDIHFHGCAGVDFCDGKIESIQRMADYQASNGITSIIPASMTLDKDSLLGIYETAGNYSSQTGAELVGINMEGPFISADKKGAQNEKYIQNPDIRFFDEMQEVSKGLIKFVTLSPEINGAMDFINLAKDKVNISIGHTTADYNTARKAFELGVNHVTHLFNAMPVSSHRETGVIGAACDSNCFVELICDGVHIHPSAIRTAFKMFGDERIILISDSMMATGMPDGIYSLGGQEVIVKGKNANLTSDGSLAGSVTNLMNCMRTAVKDMGIPLESAVKCAAINPAKSAGIYDKYGSISTGKYANIVLLDSELNIRNVILKGQIL